LNKRMMTVAAAASILGAVSASAQGLPFSSDANTNRPWSINQQPARDLNSYVDLTRSQTDQATPAAHDGLAVK
jgi:hypothetical protein